MCLEKFIPSLFLTEVWIILPGVQLCSTLHVPLLNESILPQNIRFNASDDNQVLLFSRQGGLWFSFPPGEC
jgi:hypothetical protein